MKKYFTIPLIFLLWNCSVHKTVQRKSVALNEKYGFYKNWNSYERNHPITNREYLIFLFWNIEVLGYSYPEEVLRLLPDGTIPDENIKALSKNWNPEKLFDGANGILKDYILNRNYVDYPLTGLNRNQLEILYKWMTDRFNETKLIDIDYLNFNTDQRDEDNFSLEAFLFGQYEGSVQRGDVLPRWKEGFFVPNFRPQISNYYYSYKPKQPETIWRTFPMDKGNFLWRWNKEYFGNKKEIVLPEYHNFPDFTKIESKQIQRIKFDTPFHFIERFNYLDSAMNLSDLKEIDRMKNHKGNMHFIIIGEDIEGNLIVKEDMGFENETSNPYKATYWLHYDEELVIQ